MDEWVPWLYEVGGLAAGLAGLVLIGAGLAGVLGAGLGLLAGAVVLVVLGNVTGGE